MIEHIVLLALADEPSDALRDIMQGLDDLRQKMPGMVSFEHGPNRDYEGRSENYDYGFIARFSDRNALQAYAIDPEHKALGARMVALCRGQRAGVTVVDLETG